MKSTLKKNWERIVLCLCMANFACIGIAQTNKKLDDQVINTMKTATRFMMNKVSYNGGFVWNYLPDMSRSWGEMEAKRTMVWIQPPGTPSVGHLLLDAYHATGDEYYYEAAKKVAASFVSGRESDNMGLVIFAGESFTALPMTTDRSLLANYINEMGIGMLEDGTAIGDGLATAINRIKDGKAKSKSIILLTDGSNNTGNVAPVTASEIAKKLGIKVYTIGVGRNGNAPYPTQDMSGRITYTNLPVVIDEQTLQSIASNTGGKYFRATDNSVLSDIFSEIDQLEKSRIDVQNFSHTEDDYLPWAILACGLLILELVIRNAWLKPIP